MKFFSRILLCVCVGACAANAQNPLSQILQPPATTAPANAAPPTSADSLGRDTPYGTVFGFLQSAQAGNYALAAEYLQLTPARRQSEGPELAQQLNTVLNSAFTGSLKRVSTQQAGEPQEGVPPDRQHLGLIASGDAEAEFDLVRVPQPGNGRIWLVASDTLEKVPEVFEQLQARQMETRLPSLLVRHQFGGMPIWQWLALLIGLPVAAAAAWIVLMVIEFPRRWWARRGGAVVDASWRSVSTPAWLLVATFAHRVWTAYLRLPLLPRHYYYVCAAVLSIIAANWLAWRIIRMFLRRVRAQALSHGRVGAGSLMILGERIVKSAIFVIAIFAVLGSLGFNLTTALAGLGIGGIAIGFGAQKTIENLFGGLSVLADETIRVGEVCKFGDTTGTVEDIGLRSTRVRTADRTLLTIPNGTLATINLENLSRRDKILFKADVGVRYETSPDQLRHLLTQIRALLYGHPRVEAATARVRFTELKQSSLNIEIFSYILTRDGAEFLAVREDLLLHVLDLIDQTGTGLALPSQTLYLGRDSGKDSGKTSAAEKSIEQLRAARKLPFPDHAPEEKASLQGTVPYPPAGSVQAEPDKSGK